jgi:hypothetical protein
MSMDRYSSTTGVARRSAKSSITAQEDLYEDRVRAGIGKSTAGTLWPLAANVPGKTTTPAANLGDTAARRPLLVP